MSEGDAAVEVSVSDGVALVVLNRPDRRNAISGQLLRELREAYLRLDADRSVAAIVLTGRGKAFCAGIDLAELGDTDDGVSATFRGPVPPISKPTIGALNGDAITGGLELALSCDLLIAAEHARFADTHVRFGVVPEWGMLARLPQRIGVARALEMALSARFVTASEALTWGLVNRVVTAEALRSTAIDLARMMAGHDERAVRHLLSGYRNLEAQAGDCAWRIEQEQAARWNQR